MVAAWPEALDEPVRQPDGSWMARFMPLPPGRCRFQQNANLPQLEEVRVSRQVNRHARGFCPRAEARLDLRPPERSALRALVRPHAHGRRLILAAAQSRPRNPSYGAAAARAAGRQKPEQIESSLLFPKWESLYRAYRAANSQVTSTCLA